MSDAAELIRKALDLGWRATPAPWQARFLYRVMAVVRRYAHRFGLMFESEPGQDWIDAEFCAEARSGWPETAILFEEALREVSRLHGDLGQAAGVIRAQERRSVMLESDAESERLRANRAAGESVRRGLLLDQIDTTVAAAGWPMKIGESEPNRVARAIRALKEVARGQQKRADGLAKELEQEQLLCLDNAQSDHWLKRQVESLEQGIRAARLRISGKITTD